MGCSIAALLAALAATPSQVDREGVRIGVSIMAHIYTWEVTNVDGPPITSFEVEQHHCYDHRAPDGWQVEVKGVRFRAWTTDQGAAIRPSQTKAFSARVTSTGAVLGRVAASVGFGPEGGDAVTFPEVWGPVPKPRLLVAAVALTITGIVLLHVLLLTRRSRRRAAGPGRDR